MFAPALKSAVTAAALGVGARLVTRIGNSPLGTLISSDLAAHGVDVVDLADPLAPTVVDAVPVPGFPGPILAHAGALYLGDFLYGEGVADTSVGTLGRYDDIILGDDGSLSYVESGTLTTVAGNALTADGDHAGFEISTALKLTLDIVQTDVSVGAGAADIISGGAGDDIVLGGGAGHQRRRSRRRP